MMRGKRYTKQEFHCPICQGSYSRKWVLERHFNNMHGPAIHSQSDRRHLTKFSTNGQHTADLFRQNHINKATSSEPFSSDQTSKMFDLTLRLAQANHSPRFIVDNSEILRNFADIMTNNYLLPRKEISGFSGYTCPRCLNFDVVPIKDFGYDLTACGRHKCRSALDFGLNPPKYDEHSLQRARDFLKAHIIRMSNWWIPGEKFLVFRKVEAGMGTRGHDIFDMEDLGKGHKYPYVELFVTEIPWLERVQSEGSIKLTSEDLDDFVQKTEATFGIFPVWNDGKYIIPKSSYAIIYISHMPLWEKV